MIAMISHANSYDSLACTHGAPGTVPWLMQGSNVEPRHHAARVVGHEVEPVDTCLRVSFMATYMDSFILFGLVLFIGVYYGVRPLSAPRGPACR